MHATWLSNGLGGQSMRLLKAVIDNEIALPVTVSITADTGSEEDCQLMTGERITARDLWERYVKPMAENAGITAIFQRAKNKHGGDLPALKQIVQISSQRAASGKSWEEAVSGLGVPLFTNDRTAGRLRQSCTSKWKVRAIKQAARQAGVTKLRSIIGYHYDEAQRRIKGAYIGEIDGFDHYKPFRWKKWANGSETKVLSRWEEQIYPLVDWQMGREEVAASLQASGVPYLLTSECDFCPHQDYDRWARHSPEVLQEIAEIEAGWQGKLFFTDKRVPLLDAIEQMKHEQRRPKKKASGLLFSTFGCSSELCGI